MVVAFNEQHVLKDTILACDRLSYSNRVTILADDSTDPEIVEDLRQFARSRGCIKVEHHPFVQEYLEGDVPREEAIEIWESEDFILFHRPSNIGFKGGSLKKIQQYLDSKNIELMYLLDSDWHPQVDALEKTLGTLEADPQAAFVQTRRISSPIGMNAFQKYVSLVEEGCYYVDFEGRQALGHPILFSGCCTLFRMDAIAQVGGFTLGHLTEDLDLTDRLWLSGWKGIYLGDVVNYGEVPFTYEHFRKQQERWAAGSARAFKENIGAIIKSRKLNVVEKMAAVRQNAYFITTLLTGVALLLGIITVLWLAWGWNSYAVEYYLYLLGFVKAPLLLLIYFSILSNFVEPLIMIFCKKRAYREVCHIPMMVWYAWSILPTYIKGNVIGLAGIKLDWFRTPKYVRGSVPGLSSGSDKVKLMNLVFCAVVLMFYFFQGFNFGWFDEFSLLLVPAFLIASIEK